MEQGLVVLLLLPTATQSLPCRAVPVTPDGDLGAYWSARSRAQRIFKQILENGHVDGLVRAFPLARAPQ